MSLLGIDIGSGSVKGVAFTARGGILAEAAAPYRSNFAGDGRAEAAPEEIWEAFAGVCRRVGAAAAGDLVEALAIASHGETFIPMKRDGSALGPAVMNADNRAADEARMLEREVGRMELYRITGVPPHPMYALPKILWLKRHAEAIYRQAELFASPAGYIQARLGLPPAFDVTLAGRTLAFDLDAGDWSRAILSAAGIPSDRLPEVRPAGAALGRLSRAAAESIGLPAGAGVALGGHDQPCGALGAGCVQPGDVADSAGTYECLTAASRARPDAATAARFHLNTGRHVIGGLYATLAFFPAGLLTRWFAAEFAPGRDPDDFFREAEERIGQGEPGPTGICVLPHWVGACNPAWDARATGVIVGLTPRADRWRLYRAIFEGIACELTLNVEALEQTTGAFDRVRIFGGNARHPFSIQLRADVTGKRVEALAHPEAVCLGAALLAGVAAGLYRDAAAAAAALLGAPRRFDPNPAAAKAYDPQIRRYRAIFPALRAIHAMPWHEQE
jgi:xylulokinase